MSKPINTTEVRLKVSEIIHSLGFVIDFCECANAGRAPRDPGCTLSELTNAGENVIAAKEKLIEIEFLVSDAMVLAEKAVAKSKARRAKR